MQDGVVLIHELVPDDARRRARRPGGAGRRRRRRRRRGRRRGRHRDRTIDGAGGSVRSRWCLVGDALACRDGRIRGRTGAGRARQGGRGEGVDGGAARARRRRSAARAPRRRPRSIDRREEREARTDGRTDASERRGDAGGTASRSRRRAVDVAKDASTRRDERRNRSGDDRAAGRRAATRAARRPRASRRRRRSASKILRDERIERISSRRASLAAPGGIARRSRRTLERRCEPRERLCAVRVSRDARAVSAARVRSCLRPARGRRRLVLTLLSGTRLMRDDDFLFALFLS